MLFLPILWQDTTFYRFMVYTIQHMADGGNGLRNEQNPFIGQRDEKRRKVAPLAFPGEFEVGLFPDPFGDGFLEELIEQDLAGEGQKLSYLSGRRQVALQLLHG